MNLTGEDCFFYLNSYCVKGRGCPFRHEPLARETDTVCLYWEQGRCSRIHCMYRHSRVDGMQGPSGGDVGDAPAEPVEASKDGTEEYNPQEEPFREPPVVVEPTPLSQIPQIPHIPHIPQTNKIIVNKKKLADLGLPIEAIFPGLSKEIQRHRSLKDRIGIKSRLGYTAPSSRLLDRLGYPPPRDVEMDPEEERLRTMAIQSIDLRARIKAKPRTEDDETYESDTVDTHVRKVILPRPITQDELQFDENESAPSLAMRIAMKRDNLYSDLKREDEMNEKGVSNRRSQEDERPRYRRSRTPDSYRRRRTDREKSWRRPRRSSERKRRRSRSRSRDRSRSPRRHRTEVPTVMSKISIVNSDSSRSKEPSPSITSVPNEADGLDNQIIEKNDQKEAVSAE